MRSPLEAVEAWLGEELTAETAHRLASAPHYQIELLLEAVEAAGPWRLPPIPPGQTRPWVDPQPNESDWKSLMLLATDGAAVNPINTISEQRREHDEEGARAARFSLEIHDLLHMKPLVDAGILHLFDRPQLDEDEWVADLMQNAFGLSAETLASMYRAGPVVDDAKQTAELQDVNELAAQLSREWVSHQDKRFLLTPDDFEGIESAGMSARDVERFVYGMFSMEHLWPAAAVVLSLLKWQEAQDYRLHVTLTGEIWDVAQFIFERFPLLDSGLPPRMSAPDSSFATLAHLHDACVPAFAHLSTEDLVLVHQNDDAVALWRGALRSGLSALESIDRSVDNWAQVARQVLDEALLPDRRAVEKHLKASRALSNAVKEVRTIAIAGLGAAASMSVGGSLGEGLAAAGGSSVAAAVSAYVTGLRQRRTSRALLNHFLVFSPQDESASSRF